jgi:O-antigen/teichoic acid export membrane protein
MSLSKSIVYNILTQIVTLIISLVAGIISTRILGANGIGIYTLLQSDVELFTLVFSFSINTSIFYYYSKKLISFRQLFRIALILLAIGTVCTTLLVLVNVFYQDGKILFPKNFKTFWAYAFVVIGFFLSQLSSIFYTLMHARSQFRLMNIGSIISVSFNLFFSLMLFVLWRNDCLFNDKVHTQLLFGLTLLSLNLAFNFYVFKKSFKKEEDTAPQSDFKTNLFSVLKFALISHISHIVNFLNYKLDYWFVEYFSGSYQLGLYAKAVNVAQMFWMIANSINNVMLSHLTSDEEGDKRPTFIFYSRINFSLILFLSVIGYFAAPIAFPLVYGPEFSESVFPYQLLLLPILLSSATKLFSSFLYSKKYILKNLYATITGVVFTLALDIFLIPRIGIVGACIASMISYTSVFLVTFYFAIKDTELKMDNYFLLSFQELKTLLNFKSK